MGTPDLYNDRYHVEIVLPWYCQCTTVVQTCVISVPWFKLGYTMVLFMYDGNTMVIHDCPITVLLVKLKRPSCTIILPYTFFVTNLTVNESTEYETTVEWEHFCQVLNLDPINL